MKITSRILCSVVLASGVVSTAFAQPAEPEQAPEIVPHRINPRFGGSPPAGSTTASSAILYHGGSLIAAGPTVYVIWYGNWTQGNGTDTSDGQQIVTDFLGGIGGSPYFDINRTYSTNLYSISGGVTYGGATSVKYLYGSRLSDSKVQSTVSYVINNGLLPYDANGVYFVLSSSDVAETSGFCTRYCGWHTHASISGNDVKYSFVGNAARCITACAIQSVGPNNNGGVDGMVSVIAHELEEATSDPDLNAWYDSGGAENADKCAWTFGQKINTASNGAYYNVILPSANTGPNGAATGTRQYEIQRNLAHGVKPSATANTGDYCALSYDPSTGSITQ